MFLLIVILLFSWMGFSKFDLGMYYLLILSSSLDFTLRCAANSESLPNAWLQIEIESLCWFMCTCLQE